MHMLKFSLNIQVALLLTTSCVKPFQFPIPICLACFVSVFTAMAMGYVLFRITTQIFPRPSTAPVPLGLKLLSTTATTSPCGQNTSDVIPGASGITVYLTESGYKIRNEAFASLIHCHLLSLSPPPTLCWDLATVASNGTWAEGEIKDTVSCGWKMPFAVPVQAD